MSMYLELVQLNPTINKLCDIVSSAVRANPSSISDEKRRGLPSQNTEGQISLGGGKGEEKSNEWNYNTDYMGVWAYSLEYDTSAESWKKVLKNGKSEPEDKVI